MTRKALGSFDELSTNLQLFSLLLKPERGLCALSDSFVFILKGLPLESWKKGMARWVSELSVPLLGLSRCWGSHGPPGACLWDGLLSCRCLLVYTCLGRGRQSRVDMWETVWEPQVRLWQKNCGEPLETSRNKKKWLISSKLQLIPNSNNNGWTWISWLLIKPHS